MAVDLDAVLRGEAMSPGRPLESRERLPVALVTMELQRGVMGDLAALPELRAACEAMELSAKAGALCRCARAQRIPVIHNLAGFRRDRQGSIGNARLLSAMLAMDHAVVRGEPSAELIAELGPEPTDIVLDRVFGVSPFLGTSLDMTLRNLGASVVIVTGVSVNLGVLGLCIEAVNLGYQVLVPTDAVCGVPADYAASVIKHTLSLITTRTTTAELEDALSRLSG